MASSLDSGSMDTALTKSLICCSGMPSAASSPPGSGGAGNAWEYDSSSPASGLGTSACADPP
eukprot:14991103-Alexandrium_andersonii.AAC.1